MNFGMIPYEGLTEEMFLLPEKEQLYLPGQKNNSPQIYIGLSHWTYQEQQQKIKEVPKPGTLAYYFNHFNAVELNATHYNIPDEAKLTGWYKSSGSDFKFCPLLYKGISGMGPLGPSKLGLANDFISRISGFKEKLGTAFLQLPEKAGIEDKEGIVKFLQGLPADFPLSMELRHPDWFADEAQWLYFVKLLNSMNKGLVINDNPGRRDVCHMQLSNPTAFIRFNCLGDHELDLFRIEQWKKQLKSWFLQGLQTCYFFLHIYKEDAEEDFKDYVQYCLKF